ncbi:MAG: hypothetical protein KDI19_09100 [Pseudomonadales bacterium]|nr:hypothetical protein [Pseudomonadales bacterium]
MTFRMFQVVIASIAISVSAAALAAGASGGGGGAGAGAGAGGAGMGSGAMGSGMGNMSRDAMDMDRRQDQIQDRIKREETLRMQDQARIRANPDIYGAQLMNDREVEQYRARIQSLQTTQERDRFMATHKEQMDKRASRMGVTIQSAADMDRDQDRDRLRDQDRQDDPDQDRERDMTNPE